MSDLAMDFIETPAKEYGKKKHATGIAKSAAKSAAKSTTKKPKVTNMNKDQFKKAKAAHKTEIAKIKAQRAKLKQDIKRHKLLIKQAKIVYKVTQMKEAK